MTDLSKLRVSLTKHGAHKIAFLLEEFEANEVLNHLEGDFSNINIDPAQTKGILSIDREGNVPILWSSVKKFGKEDIHDLVFLGIVFSHQDLINAMSEAYDDDFVVHRGKKIEGKVFTNFARILDDLGFAIQHTPRFVTYNISRITQKPHLKDLILSLMAIKLEEAGWQKENTIFREAINQSFHKALGLTRGEFLLWSRGHELSENDFFDKRNVFIPSGIKFKSGHIEKYAGKLDLEVSVYQQKNLLHNRMQNEIFELLKQNLQKGEDLGTETFTTAGFVDIVKKSGDHYTFYEIKTSRNIKSSIRQALPQLLEYAFWGSETKVIKLVIISPNSITEEAMSYLLILRKRFEIPIFYQSYNLRDKTLSDLY